MTIKVGDRLPETDVHDHVGRGAQAGEDRRGVRRQESGSVRGARRLHADLPQAAHGGLRARTTTSSRSKGFDVIACTAINDIFVLTHWAKDSKADGKILMLADGSAEFAKKIGLDVDLGARGMGVRSSATR